MKNSKLFRSKLNIVLVVLFSVFLLIISVKSSDASTCIPGALEYDHWRSDETRCPNSGEACEFEIWEVKREAAICSDDLIATTISPCRIRENEEPFGFPPWDWPEVWGGNTLRGPCYPVIGSAPCGEPNTVSIWWQYVKNIGGEAACDPSDCFWCIDISVPPDGIPDDGIPDCELEYSRCPD